MIIKTRRLNEYVACLFNHLYLHNLIVLNRYAPFKVVNDNVAFL